MAPSVAELSAESLAEAPVSAPVVLASPEHEADLSVEATADRVLRLLESYCYRQDRESVGFRHDPVQLRHVTTAIAEGRKIHMVLPAFPFKSPNKIEKVYGILPDMGEEFALARLEGMALAIEEIYPTGAEVCVISDGLVYNDLLGVSDEDVWTYGSEVRRIAQRFPHISFARFEQLLSRSRTPRELSKEEYISNAPRWRQALCEEKLTEETRDFQHQLKVDPDVLATYRGYIRFLSLDIRHVGWLEGKSKSMIKKEAEKVAKQMIIRGRAYAQAVVDAYPNSVRLSIHPSITGKKLSIPLLGADIVCTPWHGCIGFEGNGDIRLSHKEELDNAPELSLYRNNEDGRPWFYAHVTQQTRWPGVELSIEPQYPCGLILRPKKGTRAHFDQIDMKNVRSLAELYSPIILRGFEGTQDRERFVAKAHELGTPLPWKFGLVLEVKDKGTESGGLNNVLSAEPMPMHFDGNFKTKVVKAADGTERQIPDPPNFQLFVSISTSPPGTGYTLFSSSRLFWKHLPPPYTLEYLSKLTWECATSSFDQTRLRDLPLVQAHPTQHTPCLRYHEDWPQSKTRFDPTKVTITGADEHLQGTIEALLYDRRVCYWHQWERGDLVVSDNVAMLHTRTGYTGAQNRELWRIHVD